MAAELARAFDISVAMFSWTLIKLSETRHFWCLIAHQLATDGSARNLVARVLRPSLGQLERKNKTGVERIVVVHGGIVPAPRQRALAALRLEEREEISPPG
jgi:hypothetical protein